MPHGVAKVEDRAHSLLGFVLRYDFGFDSAGADDGVGESIRVTAKEERHIVNRSCEQTFAAYYTILHHRCQARSKPTRRQGAQRTRIYQYGRWLGESSHQVLSPGEDHSG